MEIYCFQLTKGKLLRFCFQQYFDRYISISKWNILTKNWFKEEEKEEEEEEEKQQQEIVMGFTVVLKNDQKDFI